MKETPEKGLSKSWLDAKFILMQSDRIFVWILIDYRKFDLIIEQLVVDFVKKKKNKEIINAKK